MADKKISQLTALTDAQGNDDTRVLPLADGTNGIAGKLTVAQAKNIFGTQTLKYVATGLEGSTLTIPELAAKKILAIFRETGPLFPVSASPDSVEYIWDNANITLGLAVQMAGERFLIHYRNA